MFIADQLSRGIDSSEEGDNSYQGKIINHLDIENVNLTDNVPIKNEKMEQIQ